MTYHCDDVDDDNDADDRNVIMLGRGQCLMSYSYVSCHVTHDSCDMSHNSMSRALMMPGPRSGPPQGESCGGWGHCDPGQPMRGQISALWTNERPGDWGIMSGVLVSAKPVTKVTDRTTKNSRHNVSGTLTLSISDIFALH